MMVRELCSSLKILQFVRIKILKILQFVRIKILKILQFLLLPSKQSLDKSRNHWKWYDG